MNAPAAMCSVHATAVATGICVSCRDRYCATCLTKRRGIQYCVRCFSESTGPSSADKPQTKNRALGYVVLAAWFVVGAALLAALFAVGLP